MVATHGANRITLGLDVRTYLGCLDVYFYVSDNGKLECLLLVNSLGYTDGKVLVSDEGIKMGFTDGKFLGNIIGNVDVIALRADVGIELVSLDASLDVSYDGKIESLFLINSLGSNDGKVPGSD